MQSYWLWLALHPGLNAAEKRCLLEYFPTPDRLYAQAPEAPEQPNLIPLLRKLRDRDMTEANRVLTLCREKGIRILPFDDPAYPSRLRQLNDAPVVLYCRGILPELNRVPVIGVVGTRQASSYGLRCARTLSAQLCACGAAVISGGAAGIDAAAMESALDAGFPTVGVLGCGVDIVYPKTNAALFSRLLDTGCLLSEYPPETPPHKWRFPRRNRIISGISNGVLVVEAPAKSGALITARMAFDQGRDVFVVPGNIDSPCCTGSNALLSDRALAVNCGWDIVKEYSCLYPGILQKREPALPQSAEPAAPAPVPEAKAPPQKGKTTPKPKKELDKPEQDPYLTVKEAISKLSGDEQTLALALTPEPCSVDHLVFSTGLPTGKVLGALTMLQIRGIARKNPGNRVSLKLK